MKDKARLTIGDQVILRGERKTISLQTASLYDYTHLSIPIEVVRGKKPGPVLFISAAIHGDEINGVEIIKRLLQKRELRSLTGTLILVPIVNVFGYNSRSRYLPDRRDLNRSFPGTSSGSLASQISFIFMNEVVKKCTHGIDLHTGAIHRTNLAQVRACIDDPATQQLAEEFGAPVIMNSKVRDGSLREAARKRNIPMLLFEGGEALRYNEDVIRMGLQGCLSVMKSIGMLSSYRGVLQAKKKKSIVVYDSYWVRAPHSGSFYTKKKLGHYIEEKEALASISDPFGKERHTVHAREAGVLIGMSQIPLVNKGEAMFHIATFKDLKKARRTLDTFDL